MQAFYCQLCSKGYSRMNDYEAHLSSYDHAHRQRMKDMKAMVKGEPSSSSRSRKVDSRNDGLISIKIGGGEPSSSVGSSGFKKGGFKKAGFTPIGGEIASKKFDNQNSGPTSFVKAAELRKPSDRVSKTEPTTGATAVGESDTEDEGYEVYDPHFPTSP